MALDPQVRDFLALLASLNMPDFATLGPVLARKLSAERRLQLPAGPDASVEDHRIPGPGGELLVRVYRPREPETRARAGLVWFHGGGFVLGSVAESDADCRHLAVRGECVVASVEYRLAPEHPYPAATEDAYTAACWVHAHAHDLGIDSRRLAVGGDSAGGNLAISTALRARERAQPALCLLLLIYPVTDLVSFDTSSYAECAEGYYLTRDGMTWFREQYVPRPSDRSHPHVSPLHVADLKGLPPVWLATAELDPLRDEGEALAARLAADGVEVRQQRYAGMIHGFFSMHPFLDGGKRVLADVASVLRQLAS